MTILTNRRHFVVEMLPMLRSDPARWKKHEWLLDLTTIFEMIFIDIYDTNK